MLRIGSWAHRLSQVHGDFHPWNVLFREGVDFTVLDRSRGERGEPADDVTAMTINYIFILCRSMVSWLGFLSVCLGFSGRMFSNLKGLI